MCILVKGEGGHCTKGQMGSETTRMLNVVILV